MTKEPDAKAWLNALINWGGEFFRANPAFSIVPALVIVYIPLKSYLPEEPISSFIFFALIAISIPPLVRVFWTVGDKLSELIEGSLQQAKLKRLLLSAMRALRNFILLIGIVATVLSILTIFLFATGHPISDFLVNHAFPNWLTELVVSFVSQFSQESVVFIEPSSPPSLGEAHVPAQAEVEQGSGGLLDRRSEYETCILAMTNQDDLEGCLELIEE